MLAPAEIKNKQTSLEDSQTVENTWVRKDYQASRFVITDGSQAVKGAPRWNQVYRRDTFSMPDHKLIQRVTISGKNRRKKTINGLLPCGCCDTMTVFYYNKAQPASAVVDVSSASEDGDDEAFDVVDGARTVTLASRVASRAYEKGARDSRTCSGAGNPAIGWWRGGDC